MYPKYRYEEYVTVYKYTPDFSPSHLTYAKLTITKEVYSYLRQMLFCNTAQRSQSKELFVCSFLLQEKKKYNYFF